MRRAIVAASGPGRSGQTLFEPLNKNIPWQIDPNEDHLALAQLALGPGGAQVTAHELVHALKNHFRGRALHVQDTLVSKHARPVDIDHRPQEVLELGGVERSFCTEHEALHVVIVVMMVGM